MNPPHDPPRGPHSSAVPALYRSEVLKLDIMPAQLEHVGVDDTADMTHAELLVQYPNDAVKVQVLPLYAVVTVTAEPPQVTVAAQAAVKAPLKLSVTLPQSAG